MMGYGRKPSAENGRLLDKMSISSRSEVNGASSSCTQEHPGQQVWLNSVFPSTPYEMTLRTDERGEGWLGRGS